jgi:hypothetical protein
LEILWVYVDCLTPEDLAELEPAETVTDITLHWSEGPAIDALSTVLNRWQQLRRLTLSGLFFFASDSAYSVLSVAYLLRLVLFVVLSLRF